MECRQLHRKIVFFVVFISFSFISFSQSKTWYTIASGNWDSASIWTLDPAGMLINNPGNYTPTSSPTSALDNVVILSGRMVTVSADNKTNSIITVNGSLDFTTTTGHTFSQIKGNGKILLAADNFPAGDATHFITKDQGEGTVVYYGTGYNLTTARTFYHMEVKMTNPADILTLRTNYTLNGNLTISQGVFRINDNTAAVRNLTIKGNTLIKSGTSFTAGSGNVVHNITFEGDVTNNGTIDFANDAQYSCAAGGAVKVTFSGASDNTLTCNGTTDFYRMFVDKGTDDTYVLSVVSTAAANFRLFGPVSGNTCLDAGVQGWENLALVIYHGTLKLGSNIDIPRLGENRGGTAEPYEFHIPSGARLWINGANVATSNAGGGWRGITVFGTLQISAGTFTNPANSGGITYFSNLSNPGTLLLEGGTVYTTQVKQANSGGRFNYIQTGGLLHINALSDSRGSSAVFALPTSDFVFQMSGGTVRIDAVNTTPTNGIHIACDPQNVSVTGGTFDIHVPTLGVTGEPEFEINSTAPLYNLVLTGSGLAGPQEVALQHSLEVYHLTIGANTQLDARGYDLTVHGNFTLENTGVFQHGNNTTYFTGSQNSVITIGNNSTASPLHFFNLVLNKDQYSNPLLYWNLSIAECAGRTTNPANANNTILQIENALTITRGQFSIERYTVSLLGNLSLTDGKLGYNPSLSGRVKLNGSVSQTLTGSSLYNPVFGFLELDNSNGAVNASDIHLDYFLLTNGIMDINEYLFSINTNIVGGGGFGATKMIRTQGLAGDRGLEFSFNLGPSSSPGTFLFPVGSPGEYTPMEVVLNNSPGANYTGTFSVSPVDDYHPALLDPGLGNEQYWKTKVTGSLASMPQANVTLRFYDPYSTYGGGKRRYYLLGNDWENVGNATGSPLIYNLGFLESDYTVSTNLGLNFANIIYSRQSGDWSDRNTWSVNGHDGGAINPGTWLSIIATDWNIFIIGNSSTENHIVTIDGNNAAAAHVIIESGNPLLGGVPTLDAVTTTGHVFSEVSGGGKFRISYNGDIPDGNWDNFMNNDTAIFEYYGGTYNIPNDFYVYPNLLISGTGQKTMPNQDVLVRKNLYIDGQVLLLNDADDLVVNENIIFNHAGILRFPNAANTCVVTVNNSVDMTGDNAANTIEVATGGAYTNNHILQVRGNISVTANSAITLFRNSGDKAADLYFMGDLNSTINSDGAASNNIDLNRLIINKSVSTADISILEEFSLNGTTNGNSNTKALYLISGDLTLDNSLLDINLSTGGQNFVIPSTSSLRVNNGIVRVSGSNTGVMLDGRMHVGDNSQWLVNGGSNNYIEYGASGNAEIQIDNGTLIIGSQLRRSLNAESGNLKFYQNSNTSVVTVGEDNAPEGTRGLFEVLNAGSVFSQAAGASITIVRQQTTPSVASLYLNPASYSIGSGSTFMFGNGTTPAGQIIGINSSAPLQNITISGTNNPVLRQWVLPLTLNGDLNIQAGATHDANGLDLILNKNFINNGTFTPNNNTTYVTGTINQVFTGNTTFYDLIKNSVTDLSLTAASTQLTVLNDFEINSGRLLDNSNVVNVQGDCNFDGIHIYGGSGNGLLFNNNSREQFLTGSGTLGKVTIQNPYGVTVPLGHNLIISNALRLQSGVFNIGKNLLTLTLNAVIEEANPFSATNMIQTNISFTDYGVKKYLPAGASTFVYPIGCGGKYTPVTLNITGNGNSTGSITVKAADEMHPSIQEDSEDPDPEITDADNVLQYHWVMRANGITGFSATTTMGYIPSDVKVTAPYDIYDYITAKLLNDGSGNWNKYDDVDKFDETSQVLIFDFAGVDAAGISGDYTAGVDGSTFNGAIPDHVPTYQTNNNGNWTTSTIWTPNVAGGPRGAITIINSPHTVTITTNGISSYTTTVNGAVLLNSTFGHRFGEVTGNGRIYTEREVIPAGYYDDFFSSTGGTLEYGGSSDYDILGGISTVNHLKLSGTGERRIPNGDIFLYGNLEINGGATLDVINSYNRSIELKGNLIRVNGNFEAGTGTDASILFSSSSAQTISGNFTGSNSLNILEINNPGGVSLSGDVFIEHSINLINGAITTGSNNLTLALNASISPASATTSRYINGKLTKVLTPSSNFVFPVGKNSNPGTVELSSLAGFAGTGNWSAEYFFGTHAGVASFAAPLNYVSHSEYWNIQGAGQGILKITLDGSSDVANAVSSLSDLRFAGWNGSQWVVVGGTPVISGSATSGTITSGSAIDFNTYSFITLASVQTLTLGTASITSSDVTICAGNSANITVFFTGTSPWSLTYTDGVTPVTLNGIVTNPLVIAVSPATTRTYTLTAMTANGVAGNLVGNTDVIITVNALPVITFTNNSAAGEICAGDEVIFTATGGTNYNFYLNSISVQNSVSSIYSNSLLVDLDEVYVVVTASTGCSATSVPATIQVNPVPAPVISGDTASCENSEVTYTTPATGNTFLWTVTGGTITAGQGTSTATILWDNVTPLTLTRITRSLHVTETSPAPASCSFTTPDYEVIVFRSPVTGPAFHFPNTP